MENFRKRLQDQNPQLFAPRAPSSVISVASSATTASVGGTHSKAIPVEDSGDEAQQVMPQHNALGPRIRKGKVIDSDDDSQKLSLPLASTRNPVHMPASISDSDSDYDEVQSRFSFPAPPPDPKKLNKPTTGKTIQTNPHALQPHNLNASVTVVVPNDLDLSSPKRVGQPIAVPRNPVPQYEAFDEPQPDQYGYEPVRNAKEVEADLKELVGHAMEVVNEDILEQDMVVEGFSEGFELLSHQVLGRRWMRERETGKKRGGILADDMGLGKTIQTIARILEGTPTDADLKDGWAKSTLVVCPVGLMNQWESEIRKIAPTLKVMQHHGAGRTMDPKVLSRHDVVVTSYQIASNEYEKYNPEAGKTKKSGGKKSKALDSGSESDWDDVAAYLTKKKAPKKKTKLLCALYQVQWFRVVLDEAHNIKNKAAKMSVAACELEGKFRWALTGTPLQNNVDELFPLLKFLRIRPLNDWSQFKEKISDPVKKGRTKAAMQRLHVILKAVMLRRTKATMINEVPILHLPARNVRPIECEFDEDERAFYDALANKVQLTFNKFMRQGDAMKNYTSILTLLLRLRQACSHPSLVSKDFAADADALESSPAGKDDDEGLAAALGGLTVSAISQCQVCQIEFDEDNHNKNSKRCISCDLAIAMESRRKSTAKSGDPTLPPSSAKVRKILELLDTIDQIQVSEGEMPEKTIVFSQFTSFFDLLQPFLRDEGVKFVRLDGSMNPDQRVKALDTIKKSKSTKVILISFKAGSTGLNLTCCNHVILADLWWNPSLEDQAFDRAHRMGQQRDVEIYKLTIANTVEERILQLQESKRGLAAAALSGNKFDVTRLGIDDFLHLFRSD